MINCIFWDLDGTLINSEALHTKAIIYACQKQAMPVDKVASLPSGLEGVTVYEELSRQKMLKNQRAYRQWYQYTIDFTVEHIAEALPIRLTNQWFKALSGKGIKQYVISNSDTQIIEASLAHLGLAPFCQGSIGRDQVKRGKPAPDVYLAAIEKYSAHPEKIRVFEDSQAGADAAKEAGLKVIAVNNQFNNADFSISTEKNIEEAQIFFESMFGP